MADRRFVSKIDRWLVVVVGITLLVQTVLVAWLAVSHGGTVEIFVAVLATLFVYALILGVLRYTYYVVGQGKLRIVSGPFRWSLPIADIRSIEATRNPLSSPALSLDRLRIRYGKRRSVMVSPADKAGFIAALERDGMGRENEPGQSGYRETLE